MGLQKDESTSTVISIDDKDMAILALLQENARITVRDIATRYTEHYART
jgi:hypothetical protein